MRRPPTRTAPSPSRCSPTTASREPPRRSRRWARRATAPWRSSATRSATPPTPNLRRRQLHLHGELGRGQRDGHRQRHGHAGHRHRERCGDHQRGQPRHHRGARQRQLRGSHPDGLGGGHGEQRHRGDRRQPGPLHPPPPIYGADSFTYTVSSGGVNETATVNVTVTPVTDIANDAATTNEDSPVTIAVLANDSFEGATPTVSAVGTASNGTVAIVGNQVLYSPNADFNGADSFTYTVSSGGVNETATVAHVCTPVTYTAHNPATTSD